MLLYTKLPLIHMENGIDNPISNENIQFLVKKLLSTENYHLT